MTKPNRNFDAPTFGHAFRLRAFLPLVLIAGLFTVLAAAPVAVAQDPGSEYEATPTPPTDDPAPNDQGDPVTATGAGSDDVSDDGNGTSGAGSSGSSGTDVPTGTEPATTPGTTSTGGNERVGNQRSDSADERALNGFAASGEQGRADRDGAGTAAQLTSQSDGGGSGMGVLLWIALGAIVLWAIVMAVINFRRRKAGDGTESRRGSGEQQAA